MVAGSNGRNHCYDRHNRYISISGRHISGSIEDITEFGICWGTSAEPTVNGSHAASDGSPESFASYTMGLTPGTTFYVHAYATLASGTVYGNA